jgi:hypothetical protein
VVHSGNGATDETPLMGVVRGEKTHKAERKRDGPVDAAESSISQWQWQT